ILCLLGLLSGNTAGWTWSGVFPSGIDVPVWSLDTNPKVVFPVSVGSAGYARAGESIHPPPVTNPADGSYTTTKPDCLLADPVSSSVTVSVIVYTPAAM